MKSLKEHTPGPWKVRFLDNIYLARGFFVEANNNNMPELGYGIEILQDDFGDHNGYPLEQRLADANLIAAAPDMLEALQETLSMCEQTLSYREMNGLTYGNVFLTAAIEHAKQAIKKATGIDEQTP